MIHVGPSYVIFSIRAGVRHVTLNLLSGGNPHQSARARSIRDSLRSSVGSSTDLAPVQVLVYICDTKFCQNLTRVV